MIDTKKINRVKGILSARQGAEIPKYITGGPFTYTVRAGDTLSKIVASYNTQNNTKLKWEDVASWNKIKNPNLIKVGQTIKFENPAISSTAEIPGDPKITPTTAVENSALANDAVDARKQQLITEQTADQQYNKVKPASLQTPKGLVVKSPEEHLKETLKNTSLVPVGDDNADAEKRKKQARDAVGYATTAAIQGIGNAVGAKQTATDSDLTKGIDSAYNATAQGLQNAGGVAGVVGTAMQFAGIAGNLIQELGGGTDQQTAADKWMDSALLSWNIGMLNGFAGKNTQDFGVDQSIMSQVGSSYGNTVTEAAEKAGKKYGLFSTKARVETDTAISKARAAQNRMGTIANDVSAQRLAVQSMGEQAGLAYSMMTNGGYDQKYTYSAKQGGVLKETPEIEFNLESSLALEWEPQIELNWELPTFQEGGNIDINEELEWIPETKKEEQYPKEYIQFKDSLPDNQKNTPESEYDTYLGWKLYGKPKDFKAAKELGMYTWDNSDNSWHGNTVAWDKTTGIGHFLKPKHHSTIGYELDWFNKGIITEEGGNQREMTRKERKEWEDFKSNYTLIDEGDFYKYVPKNKKGGSLGDSDVPEIEETTQKNVIPEGALHKNKHHMEHAEGLTKKGIPVIDDDGEQQAEIEHSEIIFTLEVTKKLEEYYKIFYSDESSNKEKEQAALDAGKLLVYQILENTEDRTGLIDSCKKGGTLTLKKSTDDLIEEALSEDMSVIVIEEHTEKRPIKKTKEISEKEQIKELFKEALIELILK